MLLIKRCLLCYYYYYCCKRLYFELRIKYLISWKSWFFMIKMQWVTVQLASVYRHKNHYFFFIFYFLYLNLWSHREPWEFRWLIYNVKNVRILISSGPIGTVCIFTFFSCCLFSNQFVWLEKKKTEKCPKISKTVYKF